MIELNDLLSKEGLDPSRAIVMRHRPTEPRLRRALRSFAAERPDLYNAYQACHGERVEGALGRAEHLVSLIGHDAGRALFVGIYRVEGWQEMPATQWRDLETSRHLIELGDRGPSDRLLRIFDLVSTQHLADENILARWRSYGDTGHGGNIDLKDRDPTMFQFSILERVSPDLPADEVIRVEATWKERLGTREFGLNKN